MLNYSKNFRWKFCLLPLCIIFLTVVVSANDEKDKNNQVLSLFDKPSRQNKGSSLPNGKEQSKPRLGMAPPRPTKPSKTTVVPKPIRPELLTELMRFGRDELFSPLIGKHGELATDLITVFLDAPTMDHVMAISEKYQDLINPSMFMYALSVALMHRNDTKNFPIGELSKVYPHKLVDSRVMRTARTAIINIEADQPIEIYRNFSTASDRELEHRLAYFREDFGINLHHWHWHLVHPFEGDVRVVMKDRRGELFSYMHHQILARYNAERLCNQLPRVKRLNNLQEPILEGYFPKMNSHVASQSWPPRPSGAILKDVDRPEHNLKFDIQDLERWANRLYEAVYTGFMVDKKGNRIILTEKDGIDLLGNAVESSPVLSPNFDYYGQLHNKGHMAISFVHDPDSRHMETYGIMGDSATAMRDPVFYRWHSYIDEIFVEYKKTLTPYDDKDLDYPGVKVTKVQVVSEKGKVNRLDTFLSWCDLDLSRGLDFAPKSPVRARFTHLDHDPFEYKINVKSTLKSPKLGIVRIFIGPKFDERGLTFNFWEQSNLMIEMDRFNVTIQPGDNVIKRKSTDSSLTIPLSTNSRHLNLDVIPVDEQFCGCGWPQHMLVPKGTKDGYPMELFVMISNDTGDFITMDELTGSKAAPIFCGLRNRKYPDARAMGFPFDRQPAKFVNTLSKFLRQNMATTGIKVHYTDKIV